MKRWLIGILLFVAGLVVGACVRSPQTGFAQARTKTLVQLVQIIPNPLIKPPPHAVVTGKVDGFSCSAAGCFVLVEK